MDFDFRNEYGVDTPAEVRTDLMKTNLAACNRVLKNADQFPNANFEYIEEHMIWLTVELSGRLEFDAISASL